MKHTKDLLFIKIEKLVHSPRNVRRNSCGQVEELAALIASQGLAAEPDRHRAGGRSGQAAAELLRAAEGLPASRAWAELENRRAEWLERLPRAEGEWLDWLAALPQPELLDLLGLCSASLALVPTGPARGATGLERLAGLDMRRWWEPTPEAFLNHMSKAQIAQAMKEGGGGLEAPAPTGMKKGELAALAAAKLAGRGWLTEPLKAVACS